MDIVGLKVPYPSGLFSSLCFRPADFLIPSPLPLPSPSSIPYTRPNSFCPASSGLAEVSTSHPQNAAILVMLLNLSASIGRLWVLNQPNIRC